MIRVEYDGIAFEAPEPRGRAGRQLYAQAAALIAECGWDPTVTASAISDFVFRLAAHPRADAALIATFTGGTMAGRPLTLDALDALPIQQVSAPWEALVEVWGILGFFGPRVRTALLLRPTEETPTSA